MSIITGGWDACGQYAVKGYATPCKQEESGKPNQIVENEFEFELMLYQKNDLVLFLELYSVQDFATKFNLHTKKDVIHFLKHSITREMYHDMTLSQKQQLSNLIKYVYHNEITHKVRTKILPNVSVLLEE